jgi:hypothetical protein
MDTARAADQSLPDRNRMFRRPRSPPEKAPPWMAPGTEQIFQFLTRTTTPASTRRRNARFPTRWREQPASMGAMCRSISPSPREQFVGKNYARNHR